MTVTLRQLEYFVAVVDEGTFTRAAEVLHVTQPGLSHQFQALERELGGPLLERLPRQVRLTPAGRAALPHARACLAHAGLAATAARRASGATTGELHLATLYSISVGILPSALPYWRRDHPDLKVRLVEFRHTDNLIAAMADGQADVAIGPTPPAWDGPVREIGAEEFVIVGPADLDLPTDPPRVRMADLAEREWVHFSAESGLSDILTRACTAAGFQPRVSVRTEQGPSAATLAAAGLGITLVPANIVPPHFNAVVLRPDPPINRTLCAYTRPRPDPTTTAFINVVTSHAIVTPPHILQMIPNGPTPASSHIPDRTTRNR
jgi:DNA-binding transcriptional LysR family regulator